jgi:heat shock protein HtpX
MKNMLKTTVLLAALTGLLVLIGDYFGGTGGMIIAFLFAVILNFGSYWYSDKIVLKMYGAREVSPAESPNLHRIVDGLAMKAKLPKPKVYIVESGMPNAFATGRDPKHAAVAVTTGILNLLSNEEIEGVLAHELAHVMNRDTLISAVTATLAGIITMMATMAQWAAIFGGFGSSDDDNGGIVGLIMMAFVAPLAATLIQLAISRSREYAADEEGALICKKPWALADALEKLEYGNSHFKPSVSDVQPKESSAHIFIVNPLKGGMIQSLFSTHPVTDERVKRLRAMRF